MQKKSLALVALIGCAGFVGLGTSQARADSIVLDNGFESPDMGTLAWTVHYQYRPAGTAWTFTGGTGVAANNSGFDVLNATNGNSDGTTSALGQAGFVQMGDGTIGGINSSVISQSLTLTAGFYNLSFDAEGRDYGAGSNPVTVYVYNQAMTTSYLDSSFTPTSTLGLNSSQITFSPVTDSFTIPSNGQYGLYFVGQGVGGGDATTFIDNVVVTDPPAVNAVVALPSTIWAGMALMATAGLLSLRRRKAMTHSS